jgi:beta-xylosidase
MATEIIKNPILHADYSDPDAIRVGDDYYMVSSSFTHIPGLPILHSRDLVNWKLIGHALKNNHLMMYMIK